MILYINYTKINIKDPTPSNIKRILLGFLSKYMDFKIERRYIDFNYMIDDIYFNINNIEYKLKESFDDSFIDYLFDHTIRIKKYNSYINIRNKEYKNLDIHNDYFDNSSLIDKVL